tara:strand:+ start:233 stop:469 length:237 start_codon:yes stop_codon:yes gene_type:complete
MPSITLNMPGGAAATTLLKDFCDATAYDGDGTAADRRAHLKTHLIAYVKDKAKQQNEHTGEVAARATSDTTYSTIDVT